MKKSFYYAVLIALVLCGASAHAASQAGAPANKSTMMTPAATQAAFAYNCPNGYEKQAAGTPDDIKKGAIKCVKPAASCPQGWTGSTDASSGVLTCTLANPPACPSGWQGGIQNGKLVCNPNPPAKMSCPNNTPDWQWGTKYYSESWNIVGCSPNTKPAY